MGGLILIKEIFDIGEHLELGGDGDEFTKQESGGFYRQHLFALNYRAYEWESNYLVL